MTTPPAGAVILDSHVHFWDPRRLAYPWLASEPALDRAFTPDDLAGRRLLAIDLIVVEAGRAEHDAVAEVGWFRELAHDRPWIRGVVAHAPLERPAHLRALIRDYAADPFVVGVRRNVQDEAAGFMTRAGFRSGVELLGDAGLPFDACVRAHQLPELAGLAAACPGTTIVLDHAGKPSAADPDPAWRRAMRELAACDNVVCKLSGLATETPPGTAPRLTEALLREVLDLFGPGRCLYGSDWPVMTLATEYENWLDRVRAALDGYPPADVDAVLRGNAARTYLMRKDRT